MGEKIIEIDWRSINFPKMAEIGSNGIWELISLIILIGNGHFMHRQKDPILTRKQIIDLVEELLGDFIRNNNEWGLALFRRAFC